MKKLSLTLVLGILLLNVSAFGRSSELNIRLHNYARFNVELDNQVMNNLSSSYDFYNLAPGYHYLKVYSVPVHVYGNRGAYHHTPYIIFAGSVYIGANRKVYAMIDGSNRYVVLREDLFRNNYDSRNNNSYKYNNKHGNKHNYDNYGNHYNDRNYGKSNCYAMSPNDFYALKNTILNTHFESTRFGIVKSALSLNCFTSEQIRDLMFLFNFESTRVDFAKLAYYSVIDKERFYIIYDAFNFSSSIDEVNSYISRY